MLGLVIFCVMIGGVAKEPPLAGAKVGQVALTVSDLAVARDFYAERLGLPVAIDTGSMLFFDLGGTMLMLAPPEPEAPLTPGGAVVYLSVPRIRESWSALRERGVAFVDEPHVVHRAEEKSLWMTFFRDPDGHLLALMSWE